MTKGALFSWLAIPNPVGINVLHFLADNFVHEEYSEIWKQWHAKESHVNLAPENIVINSSFISEFIHVCLSFDPIKKFMLDGFLSSPWINRRGY